MGEPSLNQLMFFQQLLNGLSIGCTYALIALGYNLMFGVLKIVNLAYGEIFMAGSFAALFAFTLAPGHPLLVIAAALSGSIFVGLLVHFLAVKPLGNVSSLDSPRHLAVLITTSGCSLVLQNLALVVFGAYPQRFPRLIPEWHINIASTSVDIVIFLNLVISLSTMSALSFFLNRTVTGLRIRALSENQELALCIGIRTSVDAVVSVILSAALAGVAAILISQVIGTVSPFVGLSYGFKGLVVLIVGGLGNMRGAVLVALLLGVSEVFAVAYFSSSYRDAAAFAFLIVLLIGRGFLSPLSGRK